MPVKLTIFDNNKMHVKTQKMPVQSIKQESSFTKESDRQAGLRNTIVFALKISINVVASSHAQFGKTVQLWLFY